jgi:hypothetical protein
LSRLARKLPPDHDLAQLRADDLGSQPIVFDNFETELIKAATAEGASPSFENLPDDGSLVARHRTDSATGERMTEFFGRESFINGPRGQEAAAHQEPRERSCPLGART